MRRLVTVLGYDGGGISESSNRRCDMLLDSVATN
jgi:hypothetical protein